MASPGGKASVTGRYGHSVGALPVEFFMSHDFKDVSGPQRRLGGLTTGVFALFILAVVGAWGWFHWFPRNFTTRMRLSVRPSVTGYSFTNDLVTPDVLDMLAVSTNDLVSGVFQPSGGRTARGNGRNNGRYSVFYAGWSARSAKEMSVVMHTPDVCWVGAGAVPVALGQPGWVELNLGGASAPFECRVFELRPNQRELTLWCTLVNGQVYGEAYRFAPASPRVSGGASVADAAQAKVAAGRRVGGNQFLHAVRERVPGTGEKQFVRLSTTVEGADWAGALERLRGFGAAWLTLELVSEASRPGTLSRDHQP